MLELALGETDIRPHVVGGIARLLRGMREWLIGERDLETADRVLSSWDIEAVEEEEGRLRALQQDGQARFAEPGPDDGDETGEDDDMAGENEQAAAALAERETAIGQREAELAGQETTGPQAARRR